MRGRNRNKGPNPLTRTYESNGPDVKIRGTAQHIADKYAQLARDSQASGDPVAAENYLQHAEHYYRIIAAAQEQFRDQFGGSYQRPFDDDGDEETGPTVNGHAYSPGGQSGDDGDPTSQPQPYEGRNETGERGERPQRFDRNDRFDRGDRQDRERSGNRQDRGDRPDRGERRDRFPRNDRQDFQRPDGQRQDAPRDNPRRERRPEPGDEQSNGLPAFLTAPVVRQPINVDELDEDKGAANPEFARDEAGGEPNGRYGVRPRRRRRTRYGNGQGEDGAAEPGADFAPEGAEPPVE
jgi:Domain of unknown function (DUF4167)